MNTAPDSMPVLSKGLHSSPKDGACIMEMASFLAGEEWSDSPACVNPRLAYLARAANDLVSDRERHLLLPLLGRLMGTTANVDDDLIREAYFAARCVGGALCDDWFICALTAALDEYDRLSGRTSHREVTPADLRTLAELVG